MVSDRRWISSGSAYEGPVGYARAVVDGEWIFVSGTTGIDPVSQAIAPDVETQCTQALAIIAGALAEAGASFDDVVRVRYILPDAADSSRAGRSSGRRSARRVQRRRCSSPG